LSKSKSMNKKVYGVMLNVVSNSSSSSSEDDCYEGHNQGAEFLNFYEGTQVSRCIKAFLDETIKDAKYYRPLIHAVESLGPQDIFHLSINSYGGSLDGALAIIGAMRETAAHVQVSVDGTAASAASIIALASPNIAIQEFSSMLIHAGTFGAFGKQSDVISHAAFVDKRIKSVMQDVYMDFLSEKEMQEVLMGRELWLDADEIMLRLEAREDLQRERELKEEELQQEIQKQALQKQEAKPKVKPPAKAPPAKAPPAKAPASKSPTKPKAKQK